MHDRGHAGGADSAHFARAAMTSGVYMIECEPTGKRYVGSSKNIHRRWQQHRCAMRKGISSCVILQNAWCSYGEQSFRFSVLQVCEPDELEAEEQKHCDAILPELNCVQRVARRFSADALSKSVDKTRARAALVTHCPRGHVYDEENTHVNNKGKRCCLACAAAWSSARYSRKSKSERQREHRENYLRNRAILLSRIKKYAAAHKAEKRAYDSARRARLKAAGLLRAGW